MKYEITSPDGRKFEITAPEGASKDDVLSYAQQNFGGPEDLLKGETEGTLTRDQKKQLVAMRKAGTAPKINQMTPQQASEQVLEDMSGGGKFAAGAGKSVYDTARGIGQLTGLVSNESVDEAAARDAALMDTGAGMGGNIAGHIAQLITPGAALKGLSFAPKIGAAAPKLNMLARALIAPKTLKGATAVGAGYSALQPVTGAEGAGDVALGKLKQAAIGGGSALGLSLLGRGIGAGYRGGKAILEPLYKKGRQQIAGRVLNQFAGNADDAMRSMAAGREIVPGSAPMASDVAKDAGISRLTQGMQSNNPRMAETIARRLEDQNLARVNQLKNIGGGDVAIESLKKARDAATKPLREVIRKSTAKINVNSIINHIDRVMKGAGGQRQALADVLKGGEGMHGGTGLRDIIKNAKTPEQLYGVRQHIGDLMNAKGPTGAKVNEAIVGNLRDLQKQLDKAASKVIPEWGKYLKEFASASKQIDRAKVGQEIVSKVTRETGKVERQIRPSSLLNMNEKTILGKATGFKRHKGLAGVLSPGQMSKLNAVREDVGRSLSSQARGKIPGSNTAQDLATQNIMKRAGLPEVAAESPIARLLASPLRFGYKISGSESMTQDLLADALMNPQMAAKLMQSTILSPTAKQELAAALARSGSVMLPASGVAATQQ